MRLITYALAASVLALTAGCGGGETTESTNPTSAANMPAMSQTAPYSQGASASGGPAGAQMGGSEEKPTGGDSAAEKQYEELEAKLAKNAGDAKLKSATAEAAYEAGHYIEYDKPGLSPREKYRPALKLYNRALELNPKHAKAAMEKKQIEDIYEQMGMPIPK